MNSEEQAPQEAPPFRITEYLPALLVVILALLLASWYVLQWMRRSPASPPEQKPGLKIRRHERGQP